MQSTGIKPVVRVFGIILLVLSIVVLVLFGFLSGSGMSMAEEGQTLIYMIGIIGIIVGVLLIVGSFFINNTDDTNQF